MSLVEVTVDLWVNPEQVSSVERRRVTKDGELREYTELRLETNIWFHLDVPLADVVRRLTEW